MLISVPDRWGAPSATLGNMATLVRSTLGSTTDNKQSGKKLAFFARMGTEVIQGAGQHQ